MGFIIYLIYKNIEICYRENAIVFTRIPNIQNTNIKLRIQSIIEDGFDRECCSVYGCTEKNKLYGICLKCNAFICKKCANNIYINEIFKCPICRTERTGEYVYELLRDF